MSIYAIGDIQGCYDQLQRLLEKIDFDEKKDKLWFAGDLVNRGPKSLQTLRFIKSLGKRAKIVLGNHDLSLLALAEGNENVRKHTLGDILSAPDRDELLYWLRHQKLCYHNKKRGVTLVHAGIYPLWSIKKALKYAAEVEKILQSPGYHHFLAHMFGNTPNHWDDQLTGWNRLRFITNAFTRMRYCYPDAQLNLKHHGPIVFQNLDTENKVIYPWFKLKSRKTFNDRIIFGHWATLLGVTNTANTYALDTGCLWGGALSAMKLPKKKEKIEAYHNNYIRLNCP